jgi:hypothetical protein
MQPASNQRRAGSCCLQSPPWKPLSFPLSHSVATKLVSSFSLYRSRVAQYCCLAPFDAAVPRKLGACIRKHHCARKYPIEVWRRQPTKRNGSRRAVIHFHLVWSRKVLGGFLLPISDCPSTAQCANHIERIAQQPRTRILVFAPASRLQPWEGTRRLRCIDG